MKKTTQLFVLLLIAAIAAHAASIVITDGKTLTVTNNATISSTPATLGANIFVDLQRIEAPSSNELFRLTNTGSGAGGAFITTGATATVLGLTASNSSYTGAYLMCWDDIAEEEKARIDATGSFVGNGIQIGGGPKVLKVLSSTASLNFDLSSTSSDSKTISVSGAAVGDSVFLGLPADVSGFGWDAGMLSWSARVTAANTVTISVGDFGFNYYDPNAAMFRVTVFHY